MAHDALAIANHLLDLARRDNRCLDPMQILKLVYIAHGWTLALTDRPLIRDAVEAWKYGPVVPSLFHTFKKYGSGCIREPAKYVDWQTLESKKIEEPLSDEEAEILEAVWNTYGGLEAFKLSALTHRQGTPWNTVWEKHGGRDRHGAVIPDALIKEYFLELVQTNAEAAAS